MKKVFLFLIISLSLVISYRSYIELIPCAAPIKYSVGSIDPRFDIDTEQFKEQVQEAEALWENETGEEYFTYDPKSGFTINLIYDKRQQRANEMRIASQDIETKQEELASTKESYENSLKAYESARTTYDSLLSSYKSRLASYNKEVTAFNSGSTRRTQSWLNQEKNRLTSDRNALEKARQGVNTFSRSVNEEGKSLNESVSFYNKDVQDFNDQFGTEFEFNQGVFNGAKINIYEYESIDDLRTVLSHELGHALGINHVNDPKSLMYYKIDKEITTTSVLSSEDKDALRRACRFTLR